MSSSPDHVTLVGISTRNRANLLPKAIASALAQAYRPLQVAVIDDGSTDHTPSIRDEFPQVQWARHEASIGLRDSRNKLMRLPGNEFYVSLDDDAWFLRGDEIEIAVARLRADRKIAAIAFDILSPDRPQIEARGEPQTTAMFIGCGHLLRLSAVAEAGYYADSPGLYGAEEKDLCLRLADLGYKIELLPGVHVWHEKAWTGRDWFPLHRSGVCNELFMTLQRCPFPDVLIVLPWKILSFFRYWLREPRYFRAGMAGLWQFFKHSGWALRHRKAVRRETFWKLARPKASQS